MVNEEFKNVEKTADELKHIEFIQAVISRMNSNSFQIKGMEVTIVSALFAVFAFTSKTQILFVGILPTLLFWFLDAYYLQQERKFRGVYNNATGIKSDVPLKPFEMPIHKFVSEQYSFYNVFWSKTISWFYGSIIALHLILALIFIVKDFSPFIDLK